LIALFVVRRVSAPACRELTYFQKKIQLLRSLAIARPINYSNNNIAFDILAVVFCLVCGAIGLVSLGSVLFSA
jgi:hypothetical protein